MARTSKAVRNRRLVVALIVIAAPAALLFAAKGWYDGSLRPLNADAGGHGKDFRVEHNMHAAAIAEDLQRDGLIRSARAFVLYCSFARTSARLQQGIYRFSPAMTVQEIATALAEGRISAVRLSVPEGYTIKQIAHHLAAEHFCKEEDFIAAARPYAVKGQVAFPRPPTDSLEGYLFPATYTLNLGLPPGPIANPGLPSLLAALHPKDTPYLFYVARSDGSHAFTKTYEEHLKAAGKRK